MKADKLGTPATKTKVAGTPAAGTASGAHRAASAPPLPLPTHPSDRRGKEKPVDWERRLAADRRMADRVDVDIDVDYSSDDTFLFADTANITNISSMGIFVQTRDPAPVGTELTLRFTPPRSNRPLTVKGVVVWTNPYRPDDINNLNPGMGIELKNLSLDHRQVLVNLVRRIALLPNEN